MKGSLVFQRFSALIGAFVVIMLVQTPSYSADKETVAAAKSNERAALSDPLSNSAISAPNSPVSLLVSQGDKRAIASLSIWEFLNLKVSGKVSEGEDKKPVVPLTLEGLSDAAIFDVGLKWRHWNPRSDERKLEKVERDWEGSSYFAARKHELDSQYRKFHLTEMARISLVKDGEIIESIAAELDTTPQFVMRTQYAAHAGNIIAAHNALAIHAIAFRADPSHAADNRERDGERRLFQLNGAVKKKLIEDNVVAEKVADALDTLPHNMTLPEYESYLHEVIGRTEAITVDTITSQADPLRDATPHFTYLGIKATGDRELVRAYDEAVNMGSPVYLEVRMKGTRDALAYADTTGGIAKAKDQKETNWGVEVSLGMLTSRCDYIGISYKLDKVAKIETSPVDVVIPASNGIETIQELPLTAPVRKTEDRVQLEYRRLVNPYFALKPTVVCYFDEKDKSGDSVWSFELPFYFFRDAKDGGLTGGITVSYRTDQGEPVAGLFIGNTFNILGQ